MNTNLSNQISEIEEEDINIIHYEPEGKVEGSHIRFLRPIVKWFGFLSTVTWGMAALFPDTLRVPASLQGWVFTISVVWFFSYCAGLFNL